MILLTGLFSFILWSLLGLFYLRKIGWKGGFFFSAKDLSPPIFLFFIPLSVLVFNLVIPLILFSPGYIFETIPKLSQYFIINMLPITILMAYFIAVTKLKKIKQQTEASKKHSREEIEAWLSSIQYYAKDLQINFYTYNFEGELKGKIIAKYGSSDSKEALLQSKDKLPSSVTLYIEAQEDNLLH